MAAALGLLFRIQLNSFHDLQCFQANLCIVLNKWGDIFPLLWKHKEHRQNHPTLDVLFGAQWRRKTIKMQTQVNAGTVSSVSHATEFPGNDHHVVVRSRDRVLHDPGQRLCSWKMEKGRGMGPFLI